MYEKHYKSLVEDQKKLGDSVFGVPADENTMLQSLTEGFEKVKKKVEKELSVCSEVKDLIDLRNEKFVPTVKKYFDEYMVMIRRVGSCKLFRPAVWGTLKKS